MTSSFFETHQARFKRAQAACAPARLLEPLPRYCPANTQTPQPHRPKAWRLSTPASVSAPAPPALCLDQPGTVGDTGRRNLARTPVNDRSASSTRRLIQTTLFEAATRGHRPVGPGAPDRRAASACCWRWSTRLYQRATLFDIVQRCDAHRRPKLQHGLCRLGRECA